MYGVEVSATLVSSVTEAVMEEVKAWQSRPLDETYPILYMDALRVKVRDGWHVETWYCGDQTLLGCVVRMRLCRRLQAAFWLQWLPKSRRNLEDG
jgi:putative transposase